MSDDDYNLTRHWTIPSEFGCEKTIMSGIRNELADMPDAALRLDDMLTAVSEACLNAMEHGNGMNPLLHVSTDMRVLEQAVVFRICDQGAGFTLNELVVRSPYEEVDPRGWGMAFVTKLADECRMFHEKGLFCVELTFTL
jgi:anti-sigma regulatory factor (Ser/Thr protein kinase)